MYKKKEIIFIVSIISITIVLILLPVLINNVHFNKKNKKEIIDSISESNNELLNIKIEGEIFNLVDDKYVNYVYIEIPKGYTYGYIINKINIFLTKYSVIDNNRLKEIINDNQIIYIDSKDYNKNIELNNSDKININLAAKYELMTLYGIGDKRSDTILEYRLKSTINSFDELQKLIGVSDDVIERIKEKAIL